MKLAKDIVILVCLTVCSTDKQKISKFYTLGDVVINSDHAMVVLRYLTPYSIHDSKWKPHVKALPSQIFQMNVRFYYKYHTLSHARIP